ncbi:MAG: DNA-processing protein DprA [Candidatus Aureabacteria bacterium]|nr:DNA-processing protein DprA [Candidatus Auribacterota bacterium]
MEHLIALNMIAGLGPVTIKRLLEQFGSAAAALAAPPEALLQVRGIGPETVAALSRGKATVDVAAEMERIRKAGVTVIALSDPAYPENLKQIYDPPPILYVRGTLTPGDRHAVAVVGARRCSHYGAMAAERLAEQIASLGLTVVSGMARGIDTAAHRGALKAKGRTIAVLGSGLNRLYPAENRHLAEEIASSGAVISEFPMETGPNKTNFPLRNRLISGLSLGVVVVEAARKSGSLITAAQAMDQGRAVFAVPGRIDSPLSRGTHDLIRDGAKLVESVEDICEEFPYLFGARGGHDAARETDAGRPRPRLTPYEEAVLGLISAQERPIDEIISTSGLSPASVSSALFSLELKHLVKQLPGKLFRAAI